MRHVFDSTEAEAVLDRGRMDFLKAVGISSALFVVSLVVNAIAGRATRRLITCRVRVGDRFVLSNERIELTRTTV